MTALLIVIGTLFFSAAFPFLVKSAEVENKAFWIIGYSCCFFLGFLVFGIAFLRIRKEEQKQEKVRITREQREIERAKRDEERFEREKKTWENITLILPNPKQEIKNDNKKKNAS